MAIFLNCPEIFILDLIPLNALSDKLFILSEISLNTNNFMERVLRMIKGKTKVSGGFRREKGAIRFEKAMSIIKTAKLRNLNPFDCIKAIFEVKSLFT